MVSQWWTENTKVKFHSLDRNTDYFNKVASVLQRDTLAPYLFIIYLDYELKTSIDLMKENTILFTNLSARAGYDTRSIFKRSLTGLNSEFSFS